jgi:hypothetical protein
MRRIVVLCSLLAAIPLLAQSSFTPSAIVSLRGVNASGPKPWDAGGWGRMNGGGDRNDLFASVRAGVDWNPSHWLTVHVSGVARREPESFGGRSAGVLEAYAETNLTADSEQFRIRAGHFFLPTSRENRSALWTSPYTLSLSAINSWIGEEVRPTGVELEWKHSNSHGILTTAATAFRDNDTSGTLLGWRGWSVGDRLGVYGETVPLPPITGFARWFPSQRKGTQPFGRDLDGRTGFAARLRWSQPGRMTMQAAHFDNRGDRNLYRDQYAWNTRFDLIGADFGSVDRTSVAAEYMRGSTGMGNDTRPAFVDADFNAFYVLVSHKLGKERFTTRYDVFGIDERDHSRGESSEDRGRSWTLTWMHDLGDHMRTAIEFTQVTGTHPAAPTGQFDGRSVTAELRYAY